MALWGSADQMVNMLKDTMITMVRQEGADLTARQLSVLLTCYLEPGPHTVRGLARQLNISKPAITRALDRLGGLDLARRKPDPDDRRSVVVMRTLKGAGFMRDLGNIMGDTPARSRVAARA